MSRCDEALNMLCNLHRGKVLVVHAFSAKQKGCLCGQHWTLWTALDKHTNIKQPIKHHQTNKGCRMILKSFDPKKQWKPKLLKKCSTSACTVPEQKSDHPSVFSWESASSTSGKLRGCNWRYPLSPRVQRQHLSLLATGGDVASDFPKESTFVAARQLWWLTFTSHWPSQRCFFRFPKKALITSGKGSIWSPMITRFSTDLESTWQKTESVWCCFSMHSLPTKKKDSKLGKSPGNVSLQ